MKVKRVLKRISVFVITIAMVITDAVPALAYTNSEGKVNETQDVSTDDTAECEVYAELGTEFRVIIPKKITLSGSSKSGSYTVDVEGDIGGTDTVKVVPEESFTLTSTGLANQTATVSQDKTQWSWSEILADSKTIGNGAIAASGITAGTWNGSFWFNISLEEGTGSGSTETKSKLTLSTDDVKMGTGDSVQVNAYLDGELVNDTVTWSSDNENITVTNGLIETTASTEVGDTATVTVTASNTENLSAMTNVLSDIGIVTYASAAEDLSIDFVVTIVDIEYSVEELNLKAGESIDVTAKIIPDTVTGTVTWSQTAIGGINLIKNGNTVTVKVASDMEAGKTYNLVATYGDYSKTLKINIVPDHVHSYESNVTTEATCTTDGVKTFTCECGDSYTEVITATGHSWEDDYTVDVEATCTTAGSKSVHCANCDATKYSTTIPATGHSYGSWTTTKEATCTVDGSKQRTCATCGDVDTAVITKLGHDYSSTYTVDKAATCTEAGSKSQHCSRCDSKQNVTEITALGHDLSSNITKESTCTEEGNKHFECSRCEYEYDETITAKGHTYVLGKYVIDKAATCTEAGSKSVHCDVCDAIITGTEVEISATGHSYDAGVITTEPTCTENGIKTFTCSKCKGTKTESVNKLGHSYSSVVTAPTCTEEGYTTHTCARCNDSYVDSKVSAIGHNFGSPIYVWSADRTTCTATRICANNSSHKETESATITSAVKVAATCTAKGTTAYTATFKNTAFVTQTSDVEDIAALGHNYSSTYTVDKAATCTEAGSKSQHCSRCSSTTNVTEIPATGHNYGTVTYSWSSDKSTCTASRTCSECSNIESEKVNSTSEITTEATCGSDGIMTYTATFTNSAFKIQTTTENIPATGEHNYVSSSIGNIISVSNTANGTYAFIQNGTKWTSNNKGINSSTATSTWVVDLKKEAEYSFIYKVSSEKNYDKLTITLDGTTIANAISGAGSEITYTATLSAGKHTIVAKYVKDASSASYNDQAYIILEEVNSLKLFHKCSICGQEEEHNYNTGIVTKEVTCTEDGEKTFTCCCGAYYTEVIPATGHSYDSPIYVWGTDKQECTATRICANDSSHKETESATVTSAVKVAATCTEKGTITYTAKFINSAFETQTCDVEDIEALGHSYSEVTYSWTEDKSTCTASRTCSECSNVESEKVNSTSEITTEATCGSDGIMTYTATFTNSAFKIQTTTENIPATGEHNFVNHICTKCNAQEAGLYNARGVMLCSWEKSGIDVEKNYTSSSYRTSTTSPYYILTNTYTTATKVVIPDSVTNIGNWSFYKCTGLTSVTIGNGVTSIGSSAFNSCTGLTSVAISDSVTSIGDDAFYGCTGLTSITIPDSVTNIGDGAFGSCDNLTSITIGNGVTSIGSRAFDYCTSLTSVTIPDSVTTIGDEAFYYCTGLTSVTIGSGVTSIGSSAFYYCTGKAIINCNIPSATSYKTGAFYHSKFTKVTIGEDVTSIGNNAFSYCENLTSITIGNDVATIGDYAFVFCSSLTSITIPDSVTTIGNNAFCQCTSLKNITIQDNVINLGQGAFYGCENLTSVTIGNGVTSIKEETFAGCLKLPSIIIPDSVTTIENNAFNSCTNLASITIPDSVTSIRSRAFAYCTKLTSVTIGNGVTSIESNAFYQCTNLTSATFKTTTGWYVGSSAGAKTTALSRSCVADTSMAAKYLKTTYYNYYWSR